MKDLETPFTFVEVWCYHTRISESIGLFIAFCHVYIKLGDPTFATWIFTIVASFWCTFLFLQMHRSFTLLVRFSLTFTLSCIRISIAACLGLLCSDSQFLGHSSTEMYFFGTEDNQMLFLNPLASLHLLIGVLKSYGLYFCWQRFDFSRGLQVIFLVGCIMDSSFLLWYSIWALLNYSVGHKEFFLSFRWFIKGSHEMQYFLYSLIFLLCRE